MWLRLAGMVLIAVGLTTSSAIRVVRAQSFATDIVQMPSPAGPGSAQPQLTVSARGVLLSWIERSGDVASLKFSELRGQAWTPAQTVSSGREWFVNWADVPSVLRLADGSLYGHWLQKSGPDTYAYDVRLARSTDDGKTWAPSFTPHGDGTQTEHGFASLFQMPRAGKWSEPAPVHCDNWQIAACPANGPALSAIGKSVALAWFTAKGDEGHTYVAFSADSGKSFGPPVRLDDVSALGRVDVALLDDGSAAATWIEFAEGKAQFRMRRVKATGERSPAVTAAGLAASRASGYPRRPGLAES